METTLPKLSANSLIVKFIALKAALFLLLWWIAKKAK